MTRLRSLLRHLTYANVVATLALFIAIGGSSYAALSLGSRDVADNSLRSRDIRNNDLRSRDVRNEGLVGRDLRRNSIGGVQILEGRLGPVPNAERVGGVTAGELKLRCPAGTVAKAAGCVEQASRPAQSFSNAFAVCGSEGRRLPAYAELTEMIRTGGGLNPEGEWTSTVYRNPSGGSASSQLEVVVVTPDPEGVAYRQAITPAQLPFRCVALPSN
jgi:hypothetical protein